MAPAEASDPLRARVSSVIDAALRIRAERPDVARAVLAKAYRLATKYHPDPRQAEALAGFLSDCTNPSAIPAIERKVFQAVAFTAVSAYWATHEQALAHETFGVAYSDLLDRLEAELRRPGSEGHGIHRVLRTSAEIYHMLEIADELAIDVEDPRDGLALLSDVYARLHPDRSHLPDNIRHVLFINQLREGAAAEDERVLLSAGIKALHRENASLGHLPNIRGGLYRDLIGGNPTAGGLELFTLRLKADSFGAEVATELTALAGRAFSTSTN